MEVRPTSTATILIALMTVWGIGCSSGTSNVPPQTVVSSDPSTMGTTGEREAAREAAKLQVEMWAETSKPGCTAKTDSTFSIIALDPDQNGKSRFKVKGHTVLDNGVSQPVGIDWSRYVTVGHEGDTSVSETTDSPKEEAL